MKTLRLLLGACTALFLGSLAFATVNDTASAAAARIALLRAEIARHDELYFRQATPEISDAEYDALKRELLDLESRHPELAASPNTTADALGDDRSGRFPTHAHRVPMGGLEKSYGETDLRRFLARVAKAAGGAPVAFVVEPKFDGLAISLTYEDGRLVRAVTRGNGAEGDVVTANLLACTDVPREFRRSSAGAAAVPAFIEIRGEVYLEQAEFDRINAERLAAGEAPFVHPRNLAVGTLKSADTSALSTRRLSVVCFGWGAWEPASRAPQSQRELLERLDEWGFRVPAAHVVFGPESVWQAVRALDVGRPDFPGPLDGAVVKVDDVALRTALGETRTTPLWAIAHKFEPERVETRLNAITLQVGRTGVLTPVAELEPVQIGGTTVARASLHNRREIERRDYRVGDTVRVEKAGEIIPQLVGVNLALRPPEAVPFRWPAECPGCATPLVTAGETSLRCPNRSCAAQVKRRIEHFVSEAALNIRGFGPALVHGLVDRGRMHDVDDVFRLPAADLPPRVAEQVERAKRAELWRFVAGLGLPDVGHVSARRLAQHFGSLEKLAAADSDDLQDAGLTPGIAAGVAEELRSPAFQRIVTSLRAAGVQPAGSPSATGPLAGKTFVLTGTLPGLSRDEAAQRVRAAGGRVQNKVTRTTSYVVAGEGGGRKLDDAKGLNVPVLSEAEFLELLSQP